MKTRVLAPAVIAFVVGVPAIAGAQIAVGTKVGLPPAPTAGTYESLGRRDPFMTLIEKKGPSTTTAPRSSKGLQSFLLTDVHVTGVTRKGTEWMAILQGPDKQSYVAKVKDRIADAVIRRIDAQGVVFVDIQGPGSGARVQETRKPLRSAAEVNR